MRQVYGTAWVVGFAALSLMACGTEAPTEQVQEELEQGPQALVGGGCNLSQTQPSFCGYGEFCSPMTSTCADVPTPTCPNFDLYPPTWSKGSGESGVQGPVIYRVANTFFGPDPFCSMGELVRYQVSVYSKTAGGLPTDKSGLSLFYHRTSGFRMDAVATGLVSNYVTNASANHATFDLSLCAGPGATANFVALQMRNGNGICAFAMK
ncbi:hypothetical protein ACLESD_14705 [Pyxidicoccus sp. 3LFB2]